VFGFLSPLTVTALVIPPLLFVCLYWDDWLWWDSQSGGIPQCRYCGAKLPVEYLRAGFPCFYCGKCHPDGTVESNGKAVSLLSLDEEVDSHCDLGRFTDFVRDGATEEKLYLNCRQFRFGPALFRHSRTVVALTCASASAVWILCAVVIVVYGHKAPPLLVAVRLTAELLGTSWYVLIGGLVVGERMLRRCVVLWNGRVAAIAGWAAQIAVVGDARVRRCESWLNSNLAGATFLIDSGDRKVRSAPIFLAQEHSVGNVGSRNSAAD
jgi:hypothetical protein